MVNKCHLIGNLGRDPEVRYTSGGQPVTKFSLATADPKKEGQSTTSWHNIICFGKTAEACKEYLRKGHKAYVEGRIQYREFEAREGGRRTITEIIADRVVFLTNGGGKDAEPKKAAAPTDEHDQRGPYQPSDDDIPF